MRVSARAPRPRGLGRPQASTRWRAAGSRRSRSCRWRARSASRAELLLALRLARRAARGGARALGARAQRRTCSTRSRRSPIRASACARCSSAPRCKPPSIFVRLLDAADREPLVAATLERSRDGAAATSRAGLSRVRHDAAEARRRATARVRRVRRPRADAAQRPLGGAQRASARALAAARDRDARAGAGWPLPVRARVSRPSTQQTLAAAPARRRPPRARARDHARGVRRPARAGSSCARSIRIPARPRSSASPVLPAPASRR